MREDAELKQFRDLMPPPKEWEEGFGLKAMIGAIFVGMIMTPASMYMNLVVGSDIGSAAQWVTIILFIEVARRSFTVLGRAEIYVLYYMAGASMASGSGLLWNQFIAQSESFRQFGISNVIPPWVAPMDPDVLGQRSFFHPAWMLPIGLMAIGMALQRLDNFGLGYVMYRLTSDVEKLPFPMAPVGAQGITALADASGAKETWRWRVFSFGAMLGMVFAAVYLALPAVSGAFLPEPISIFPLPWKDLTSNTETFLPAFPFMLSFDLGLVLSGMVLPFWAVTGSFIGLIACIIACPVLFYTGILGHWRPGVGAINTIISNRLDFFFSFGLGLMGAIAVIGVYNVVSSVLSKNKELDEAGAPKVDWRALMHPPAGRGDFSLWIAIGIYFLSMTWSIVITYLMLNWAYDHGMGSPVTKTLMAVLVFYGFIYTPVMSYISARMEGIIGMSVQIPFVREATFILTGYQGAAIWFTPFPIHDYGRQTLYFRTTELTGTKITSMMKAEAFIFPIVLVAVVVFSQFIWRIAPVPSSAFPFADKMWELNAFNNALIISSTMPGGAHGPFMEAFNIIYLLSGLGLALILFATLNWFGLPILLVYGLIRGLDQSAPNVIVPQFIGGLLGRYYFAKRFGEMWPQYRVVFFAGYGCGVGLVMMFSLGLVFMSKSVFQATFQAAGGELAAEQDSLERPADVKRRAVSLRSIALGLLGVTFICGLTAYNDYVVANTFLVGNFLPIGLLLFFLAFVFAVNGPLHKFMPRLALSRGELGVALCMTLVSCALPSSGMMRYLPAELIAPWYHAGTNSDYARVMKEAGLPDWLYPNFEREGEARSNDPVVKYYWDRMPLEDTSLSARIAAVPWAAWARPTAAWGLLASMVVGGILCLSVIFRRQWVENERLPYPLANVYLSLIEEPAPGRMLNSLFSNRWFWIAAGIVFVIHGFNAMSMYQPRIWPKIPIDYAFWGIFSQPPFVYTDWGFKSATLYFCMVGITYFLQSNVALSLWLCYIFFQVTKMMFGSYQADFTAGMQQDQNLGSVLMFAAVVLFVGRQQLVLVTRQMFSRPAADEAQGRYLPYFLAGWGLVLSAAGIVAWMMFAGMSFVAAVLAVGLGGILALVIARVVAETGLMFVQTNVNLGRPWIFAAQSLPESVAIKTSLRSFFLSNWLGQVFVHDQRESLAGFVSQSLRVADGAEYENEKSWKRVVPFTACLLLALAFGFLVSGSSMLLVEYNFGATADRKQVTPINTYAMQDAAKGLLNSAKDYMDKGGPSESHNRWKQTSIGAGITGGLGILRLRFANWPIHPVGYLLAFSYPMQKIWFSIFLGWLVKVLVVKFGGSTMYRGIRPLFVGLIIGEVGAAAFWLMISLVLNAMGMDYHAINLLPT